MGSWWPKNRWAKWFVELYAGLAVVLVLVGIGQVAVARNTQGVGERVGRDRKEKAKARWVEVYEEMSPRERVEQILAVPDTVVEGLGSDTHPGLVGLFDVEELSASEAAGLVEEIDGRYLGAGGLRPLVIVDQEGGKIQRLKGEGFSEVPMWEEVCGFGELEDAYQLGKRVGSELAVVGVDGVWGPVVDRTNSDNPVLKGRTCSGDADRLLSFGFEYARGLEEQGVVAVFKHFPGLGDTEVDPHTEYGSVEGVDWEVFEPIVASASAVMVTHVGVGGDQLPCSVSQKCMAELNKKRCENNCLVVFADAMEMAGVAEKLSQTEAAYMAVMAGVDVLVYGPKVEVQEVEGLVGELTELYEKDRKFAKRVDEAALGVLRLKSDWGKL